MGIAISTDKTKLDVPMIQAFLNNSYWAKDRTLKQIELSIEHSICFCMYLGDEQIGFARVSSDLGVHAYIMDVFIVESARGKGHAKELMQYILDHELFTEVDYWFLGTKDAHGLYAQFGFETLTTPRRYMKKCIVPDFLP